MHRAELFHANTINKAMKSLLQDGHLERNPQSRCGTIANPTVPYQEGQLFFLTFIIYHFFTEIVSGAVRFAGLRNYARSLLNPPLHYLAESLNNLRKQ